MVTTITYALGIIIFWSLVYCIVTIVINMILMSHTSKCNHRCDQGRKCTCCDK